MKKEICWNITARCNQNCKYCHRFLHIKELTLKENKKVLNKLIQEGIKEITWTGGEALVAEGIEQLLKMSFERGIKNKLITNGLALEQKMMDSIFPYLDSLTLSIDSIDSSINELIGRGKNHFLNINRILNYVFENNIPIKVKINSVISKININEMESMAFYLNKFPIYSWRIFKFLSLRETSIKNKKMFEISNSDFQSQINAISKISKIKRIESRVESDMESKYLLILADGSVVVTNCGKDINMGNILSNKMECLL